MLSIEHSRNDGVVCFTKIRLVSLWLLAGVLSVLLASCFSPWKGRGALLSINLGGGAGKAAWLPEGAVPGNLQHTIYLEGPSGSLVFHVESTKFQTIVEPGLWRVKVEAFFEDELCAQGSGSVDVIAGQVNPVFIQMGPPLGPSGQVLVTPAEVSVTKGTTQQFTAEVRGNLTEGVTWQVTGANDPATTIDTSGLLSVSGDEDSEELTVTATSTGNPSVSGTARVSVTDTGGLPPMSGSVVITGDPYVNGTLTANISGLVYLGTPGYQWKRGTTSIGTGSSYTLTSSELNGNITVSVSSTGNSDTVTSAPLAIQKTGIRNLPGDLELIRSGGIDADYILLEDISVSGSSRIPLRDVFMGTLDGNGKTITFASPNIVPYHNSTDEYAIGLFGQIDGGEVKNLKIAGDIDYHGAESGDVTAGAVAGIHTGGTIRNVSSTGKVRAVGNGSVYAGGIAGSLLVSGLIKNCYSTGEISAELTEASSTESTYAGGIVGQKVNLAGHSAYIEYCWAEGKIKALFGLDSRAGGIAAYLMGYGTQSDLLSYCVAINSDVSGSEVGRIYAGNSGTEADASVCFGRTDMTDNNGNTTWTDSPGNGVSTIDYNLNTWYDSPFYWRREIVWGGENEDKPWKWDNTYSRPRLWFEAGN